MIPITCEINMHSEIQLITSHRNTGYLVENPPQGKKPPFLFFHCSIYFIICQANHYIESTIWKISKRNYDLHLMTLQTPICSASLSQHPLDLWRNFFSILFLSEHPPHFSMWFTFQKISNWNPWVAQHEHHNRNIFISHNQNKNINH